MSMKHAAVLRRPLGIRHCKLHVTLHDDFLDFERCVSVFENVDACLSCPGVSATRVPQEAMYARALRRRGGPDEHACRRLKPASNVE